VLDCVVLPRRNPNRHAHATIRRQRRCTTVELILFKIKSWISFFFFVFSFFLLFLIQNYLSITLRLWARCDANGGKRARNHRGRALNIARELSLIDDTQSEIGRAIGIRLELHLVRAHEHALIVTLDIEPVGAARESLARRKIMNSLRAHTQKRLVLSTRWQAACEENGRQSALLAQRGALLFFFNACFGVDLRCFSKPFIKCT
jgi:hypothetical protein